jgi:hypothetical protein
VPELLRPILLRLAEGTDRLFGDLTRSALLYWTHRICALAGVPKICAHALRGTHASLAEEAGATGALVAQTLGHASPDVTRAHYSKAEATQRGTQRWVFQVLEGGLSPKRFRSGIVSRRRLRRIDGISAVKEKAPEPGDSEALSSARRET